MIKPEIWNGKTVPYMKVWNPDYLSIIYGYDYKFPHKYRKLLRQKNVNQKLRASLKEYQLGMQMLAVPLDAITSEHEAYKEIVANLLFEAAQSGKSIRDYNMDEVPECMLIRAPFLI